MNNQTHDLFSAYPYIPCHCHDLMASYVPLKPHHVPYRLLYPEPYYGDWKKCSTVLLTHNPGNSTPFFKGGDQLLKAS